MKQLHPKKRHRKAPVPPSLKKHHQPAIMRLGGRDVEVDTKLRGLVKRCWELGLETRACCQGDPEEPGIAKKTGRPDHPLASERSPSPSLLH
jgi:hypothetical protein